MQKGIIIYVKLLDEGINVWRPVLAIRKTEGKFEILKRPDGADANEKLEFEIGATVICEKRVLEGKSCLVAIRRGA